MRKIAIGNMGIYKLRSHGAIFYRLGNGPDDAKRRLQKELRINEVEILSQEKQ